MEKFTQKIKKCYFLFLFLNFFIQSAFYAVDPLKDESDFVNNKLKALYDENLSGQIIKRYELNVTKSGFCRYKRYFQNGKIEYFSFNFLKYKDLDFYGSSNKGLLYLRTVDDDVIVQTFKDHSGDIDSMASFMVIPLKLVEPHDLNELGEKFRSMNVGLKKQQTLQSPHNEKQQ
jgi:hypothetical protein